MHNEPEFCLISDGYVFSAIRRYASNLWLSATEMSCKEEKKRLDSNDRYRHTHIPASSLRRVLHAVQRYNAYAQYDDSVWCVSKIEIRNIAGDLLRIVNIQD